MSACGTVLFSSTLAAFDTVIAPLPQLKWFNLPCDGSAFPMISAVEKTSTFAESMRLQDCRIRYPLFLRHKLSILRKKLIICVE